MEKFIKIELILLNSSFFPPLKKALFKPTEKAKADKKDISTEHKKNLLGVN